MSEPAPIQLARAEATRNRNPLPRRHAIRAAEVLLNLLATVHIVWFYVNRVPPHIRLLAYEEGREPTPFQYRMLMMLPMRWAHDSALIIGLAHWLNSVSGWFPNGVRPEGVAQAAIDLVCVATAGLVARRIYRQSSRCQLLTPMIYPLTLVMIVSTYCLLNMHLLRFIYDLPSLAFFSLGMEFIYFRRNPLWIAALFMVATINRETTFFLLLFFAVAQCLEPDGLNPRRLFAASTLKLLLPASVFWLGWHGFVVRHYAANPTQSAPRVYLNLALLLMPITWPQIGAVFGYLWPFAFLFHRKICDPLLHAWLWLVPIWIGFMFYYGIFIETRIFGELIPYFACLVALVCEETLLERIAHFRPLSCLPDRALP